MKYSIVFTTLAAGASAHGVIRNIVGANGVSMPGLGVADGTPRNCASNACGAQADTCIIRDADISGGRSPLGWTQGNGDVHPDEVVASFMGRGSKVATNNGASGATGVEDSIPANILTQQRAQRREEHMNEMRGVFSGIFNLPVVGVLGLGGTPKDYPKETIVGDMAGQGAEKGMPTSNDNGEVSLIYRQVNQDGAGPLTAAIDPTSGGKDGSAFKSASMPLNMPGVGISGLSVATNTDYPITVKMPQGMTCEGEIAGVKNVCVVRVRNQAFAGPFGGAAAFVQSEGARKRAVAYRLKKRFEINREAEE
ncbi:cell surface protein (Mas1) [Cordyceps fumosorosea ARSEF 2679]|uniref:Cell surface protein (Mas1) n=1 Tax=Cordyceps fumosorosea (strain ARSEF 2679) TaxID=1081104 RepID=A0A162JT62_CORFA|nr:cell surface protein (Mas1) [Cordyceps fumosorosea ARSEF 2679]OAA48808.1 cell surface protein (Mas1) [Cordyceps fumosorosea ARSEF 2679]